MRRVSLVLLGVAALACKPTLTPTDKAATGHRSVSVADAEGASVLAGSCGAE